MHFYCCECNAYLMFIDTDTMEYWDDTYNYLMCESCYTVHMTACMADGEEV